MGKTGPQRRPLLDRFMEQNMPEPMSGCWLWIGSTNGVKDYGIINRGGYNGPKSLAHRVAYELFKGPIPKGMKVCHKCDVTACVNPDHLFLGTQQDNMDDMVSKGRQVRRRVLTHCGTCGREKAGDNLTLVWSAQYNVHRKVCRSCARDRWVRYKAKRAVLTQIAT